jgi:hypothetical protein
MDQMHNDILNNEVDSAKQRVDQAKYALGQVNASVNYPVGGGGDQTSSNSAAYIVAEARLAGARAELAAITAAIKADVAKSDKEDKAEAEHSKAAEKNSHKDG